MKAIILEEIDSPLRVADVELSELKTGQVLVKISISGICGAQLQEISGLKGNKNFLPHLLGHEGSGRVVEVGPGVTKVKKNDKVIMHWRKGDGIESDFPNYILDGKKISSGKVTTLSEYSIVSENRLTTVSDETPDELCALLGCGLSTALGVVCNDANIKFGESVLIMGCGGVGLNLIQAAKIAGAYPIIGLDRQDKYSIVKKQTNFFINTEIETIEEFLTKNNIKNVDVIIDTTGSTNLLSLSLNYLSENGRLIMVGQPKPGEDFVIQNANTLFNGQGKMVKASQGGKTNPSEDLPRYIKLHKAGYLSLDDIITHTFNLEDINEAINLLKSGNCGRIMIKIS